jgi:FtsH-binding integral membrane protein
MKKLNNKGKGIAFAILSIFIYSIPLVVLAILNHDRLFKTTETALTTFSVVGLLFFLFFAKKVVKGFCKVLTPFGFGSLVVMIISLGIKSFLDDLFIISVYSVIGSIMAWIPYQIGQVFNDNTEEKDGKPPKTLTVKQAFDKAMGSSIFEEIK